MKASFVEPRRIRTGVASWWRSPTGASPGWPRRLQDVEALVDSHRTDDGLRYLDYRPLTPPGRMVPEDLAVTILINSRVAGTAFKAVQDHGDEVPLNTLSSHALEDSDEGERQAVCDVICAVIAWPGFAASVATKVLHKKRPALIPILDNEAIFGSYMSPTWPEQHSLRHPNEQSTITLFRARWRRASS